MIKFSMSRRKCVFKVNKTLKNTVKRQKNQFNNLLTKKRHVTLSAFKHFKDTQYVHQLDRDYHNLPNTLGNFKT